MPKSDHTWFVFAGDRGIQAALSDLLGSDPYIHDGDSGDFPRSLQCLGASNRRPSVQQMERVLRGLKKALPGIMRDAGAKSAFTARVFDELRLLAAKLADRFVIG